MISLLLPCFQRCLGAILHLVCRGRCCKENVPIKGPDKNLGQFPAVSVAMETTLQWRAMDSVGPIWKCVTADAFTAFVSIFALAKQLRPEAAMRKSMFVWQILFPLYTSVSRGECAGTMSQCGRREFIAGKRNALSSSQRNNSNSSKEKNVLLDASLDCYYMR